MNIDKRLMPRRNTKKIVLTVLVLIAAAVLAVFVYRANIQPNRAYDDAVRLMDDGRYEEAIAAFEALEARSDTADNIEFCKKSIAYEKALKLFDDKDYEAAIEAFGALDGFKNSNDKIKSCRLELSYLEAVKLRESGQLKEAYELLLTLKLHKNAKSDIEAIQNEVMTVAEEYIAENDCKSAYELLFSVGHTKESYPMLDIYRAMGNGDYAMALRLGASHIIVQKGTDEIIDSAFCEMDTLKSIDLPESVKRIGEKAFYGCDGLREIALPSGVEEIGK